MTGPEHYREAERLIKEAHQAQADNGPGCGSEVHATLAHAAATALPAIIAYRGDQRGERHEWTEATS